MRGQQSLFEDVFNSEPSEVIEAKRRGRSSELIALRNECLVARYYFYGKFTEKRYNKILEDLQGEFFLSTVTIPEIVQEHFQMLSELKAQQPTRQYFVKKWPHMVWP